MNLSAIIWLVLTVLFAVIEASTTALVSVWFLSGALAAAIAALLGAATWVQLTLFAVISAALLACLRPFIRNYLRPKTVATNVDSILGQTAIVTDTIDNLHASGTVKVGAMPWSARSTDGTLLPVGTLVRIVRIEGVKVYVSRAETVPEEKEATT